MSTALYTGSFDPITNGHLDIIRRASLMFNRVLVGVGDNPAKKYTFSKHQRSAMIAHNISNLPNVAVTEVPHGKLTADVAYEANAVILKGVRMGSADFNYEWLMADINRAHQHGLQTVVLPASPEFNSVSSSAAKEICKLHGNTLDFVPMNVKAALERTLVYQNRINMTGTIGSGKSTVTNAIVERDTSYATYNIDLDVIAKDLLFTREEAAYINLREKLQHDLGLSEWTPKAVGDLIFKSNDARKILNDAVRQPLMTRIRAELIGKCGTIIFNGALIVEAGWTHLANHNTIVLDVHSTCQFGRLKKREYGAKQMKRRILSQLTTDLKIDKLQEKIKQDRYGSYKLIDTTEVGIEDTVESAEAFIQQLKQ